MQAWRGVLSIVRIQACLPESSSRGRDYCSACGEITPWTANWLLRPSADDFSRIELELLHHIKGYPKPENYSLTSYEINSPYYGGFINFILRKSMRIEEESHPKHLHWKAYKNHLSTFEKHYLDYRKSRFAASRRALTKEAAWRNLTGREFEIELGRLLRNDGYLVKHVGGPADNGADLLISKAGRKIVVQCKAHAKKIGPGPVRDLNGCLGHHGAHEGWLVSLEGYSDAAFQFAHMKPVRLLTIAEVLKKIR